MGLGGFFHKIGAPFRSLRDSLIKGWIAARMKDAGEGESGPAAKAVYWWVHDHAILVGLVMMGVDFLLIAFQNAGECPLWLSCPDARDWLAYSADVLLAGGIAVNFHAADPPRLPEQMHERASDRPARKPQ